jgi:hypothetical protein
LSDFWGKTKKVKFDVDIALTGSGCPVIFPMGKSPIS